MIQALLLAWMFPPAIQSKGAPPETATLVRVYVHTDDAGDVSARDARRQSLKDLRAALTGKKNDLILVKTEEEADVLLEVVDRTTTMPKVAFGPVVSSSQPSRGTGLASPVRAVHLHVTLTYGGDPVTFTNKAALIESTGGWRSAADDIAKQVDKWIVDHRGEILAKRGGPGNSTGTRPNRVARASEGRSETFLKTSVSRLRPLVGPEHVIYPDSVCVASPSARTDVRSLAKALNTELDAMEPGDTRPTRST